MSFGRMVEEKFYSFSLLLAKIQNNNITIYGSILRTISEQSVSKPLAMNPIKNIIVL